MTTDLRRNDRFEMLMWLLAVALLALLAGTLLAHAAEPCLTKQEARAKWPTSHIWWKTADHCWTNNPKQRDFRKRESKPDLTPRPAPPARADANGNDDRSVYVKKNEFNSIDAQADKSPTVLYPPIIVGAPPPTDMLTPTAITRWPLLIDVDVQQAFTPWEFRVAGQFN